MDRGQSDAPSYYSLLGIRRNSSLAEIRGAYRRLALKWHPDKWTRNPTVAVEAKQRFQQIQEAYSVLSDQGKRAMYDAALYNPFDDEEDEEFSDFMQEMLSMMDNVGSQKDSFEDLQTMFMEMVGDGGFKLGDDFGEEMRRGTSDARRNTSGSASQGSAGLKRASSVAGWEF
ncbi:uncharacterized protein LOC143853330 [Tasmannia lanceolata]|uniref:uncharacterized protein LOC143853330 n=1 Tax=Tasmannia lanceolata TaxID=3420 RepID=UPI0040632FBD